MKYGFIGCGNMGGAIAAALSKATKDILLADPLKAEELSAQLGCACGSGEEAAACQRLFLAVKPQVMGTVLEGLRPVLAEYVGKLDAVVLGCTHYPFAAAVIGKILGEKTRILDGGEGTARETKRRLVEKDLLFDGPGEVQMENSSADAAILSRAMELLR